MPSTTIILVDDNAAFRTAMAMLLRIERSFELIAEAADGATAVRLAAELLPDVVLMDVEMPGGINGIEATRQVRASWAGHSGVVLALSSSNEHKDDMLEAGATAFVSKDRAHDIIGVIKKVTTGEGEDRSRR